MPYFLIFIHRFPLVVYYDDAMSREYSSETRVKAKVREAMVYVSGMLEEENSLRTKFVFDPKTVKILHAKGQDWSQTRP